MNKLIIATVFTAGMLCFSGCEDDDKNDAAITGFVNHSSHTVTVTLTEAPNTTFVLKPGESKTFDKPDINFTFTPQKPYVEADYEDNGWIEFEND